MKSKSSTENGGTEMGSIIEPEIVDSLQNAVQRVVDMPGVDLEKFAEVRVDIALIPTIQMTFVPRR